MSPRVCGRRWRFALGDWGSGCVHWIAECVSGVTSERPLGSAVPGIILQDGGYDDPVLLKAEKQFEQWKTRYDNEKKKGLIKTTNTTTKYLKEAA